LESKKECKRTSKAQTKRRTSLKKIQRALENQQNIS